MYLMISFAAFAALREMLSAFDLLVPACPALRGLSGSGQLHYDNKLNLVQKMRRYGKDESQSLEETEAGGVV